VRLGTRATRYWSIGVWVFAMACPDSPRQEKSGKRDRRGEEESCSTSLARSWNDVVDSIFGLAFPLTPTRKTRLQILLCGVEFRHAIGSIFGRDTTTGVWILKLRQGGSLVLDNQSVPARRNSLEHQRIIAEADLEYAIYDSCDA
jgi:hypothetical protein